MDGNRAYAKWYSFVDSVIEDLKFLGEQLNLPFK